MARATRSSRGPNLRYAREPGHARGHPQPRLVPDGAGGVIVTWPEEVFIRGAARRCVRRPSPGVRRPAPPGANRASHHGSEVRPVRGEARLGYLNTVTHRASVSFQTAHPERTHEARTLR